jgi:hypothetical protein
MTNKKQHVALTKCLYCGGPNEILLATRYDAKGEPLSDLAGFQDKVVSAEPCPTCKDYMAKGIVLVGIRDDQEPPPRGQLPNPYRTGEFIVVSEGGFERMMQHLLDVAANKAQVQTLIDLALKHRFAFIDQSTLKMLGLLNDKGEVLRADGSYTTGEPEPL